jgi:hypothetical protein
MRKRKVRVRARRGVPTLNGTYQDAEAIPSFIDEDFDRIDEAEEEIREAFRDNDADD